MEDPTRFDAAKNITTIAGRRIVFHCHHYNAILQRTIDEALGEDAATVQRAAAAESARAMLAGLLGPATGGGADFAARVGRAGELFGTLGFGLADVSGLTPAGGPVALRTSHYAVGWRAKFGAARAPVCHFAAGYWAGAVAVAAGVEPERVLARERRCAAVAGEGHGCEVWVEVL